MRCGEIGEGAVLLDGRSGPAKFPGKTVGIPPAVNRE
jgi:hypothetical protein